MIQAWSDLEALAPASIYQTLRWLKPWTEHVAAEQGLTPMFVLVRDEGALPLALLPFGVRRKGGLRVAEFLGGQDSNANMGLFRPGTSFSAVDLRSILNQAAAASASRPDAFILGNQPHAWGGVPNPLRQLPHQPSPSYLHGAALAGDVAAYLASRQSSATRKKMRTKTKRLAEYGEVRFVRAMDEETGARLLSVLLAQKQERLAAMGLGGSGYSPGQRAFFAKACLTDIASGAPAIELCGLMAGERVVGTWGGGVHQGRYHGMINSYDMDPAVADNSPGELLLAQVLSELGARGLDGFDLGVGEARYKETWCERVEPLFDTLHGVTPLGRAYCLVERARRRIKRAVKQNHWLWPRIVSLRKRLAGVRPQRGAAAQGRAPEA